MNKLLKVNFLFELDQPAPLTQDLTQDLTYGPTRSFCSGSLKTFRMDANCKTNIVPSAISTTLSVVLVFWSCSPHYFRTKINAHSL